MKMWQLFILMMVIYLAPNLKPNQRMFMAFACMFVSVIFGYFKA